jgi:hypothetical protein
MSWKDRGHWGYPPISMSPNVWGTSRGFGQIDRPSTTIRAIGQSPLRDSLQKGSLEGSPSDGVIGVSPIFF